ncbi:MAG: 4Fe-4S binding protein [Caldithrix sp.]|nr:4Fe-4S binding protein [Caldithrix sp.]
MRSFKTENLYRKLPQYIIIVLLAYMVVRLFLDANYLADFEKYCPFGGMQALGSFMITNTLACTMNETQIFMGIALFAGVILVSKLFCSYLCPLGLFTEWLGKLGQRFKLRWTIRGMGDRLLRVLKYALLFVTLYFTFNSSELFCKKYDPYYAAFSGFDSDVFLWYAIPAIAITVLGAFFVRQFWCKYLCPLGAASNIFVNVLPLAAIVLIYTLLRVLGVNLNWIWLIAALSVGGFLLEVLRMKGIALPPVKITRNDKACTNCLACDEACPMDIPISEQNPVRHIDCHLCGDCLDACPEGNVLQMNRRNMRWLPPLAVVVLVALGIGLASTIQLPTINLTWADGQQMETAAVFSKSGLKNIKCYGSSMSFANRMKRVDGVLGVKTYVETNRVDIYYDPALQDEQKLDQVIFTPAKTLIRFPMEGVNKVHRAQFAIDHLFDSYDTFYLTKLLQQAEGIYGFTTAYGEPVATEIYFNGHRIDVSDIKAVIESDQVTYVSRGKSYSQSLRFAVASVSDTVEQVEVQQFKRNMFDPYDRKFNGYAKYAESQLRVYKLPMPQALNPNLRRRISYLVSHLSSDSAVVRFRTVYEDKPQALVYFVEDAGDGEHVYELLNKAQLTVHYRNGKTAQVPNPFKFAQKGKTLTAP